MKGNTMSKHISVCLAVVTMIAIFLSLMGNFSAAGSPLTITKAGGWYETAYAEWSGGSGTVEVSIKKSSEADSAYKKVDAQLIRGTRVDIPGLVGDTSYDLKVKSGASEIMATVKPMKHDRTGYAHWKRSEGVGAYNNDGTPKSDMSIIYVTDSNKDSISHGGRTGIYNILNNASASSNLIVRIVGTVNVPSGVDRLSHMVRVRGSNLTIEGIGHNANINRWGFTVGVANSVEIRNLYFYDYLEDAIEISGNNDNKAHHMWIHNNLFAKGKNEFAGKEVDSDKKDGDGSTDIKRCEYITISYNHYQGTQKSCLVGGGQADMQDWITFHHNYFDGGWKRHPMARNAHIHMLNNYFRKISAQAIAAAHNAMIFSEGNTFESCAYSIEARRLNGDDTYGGTAKSWGDSFSSSPRNGKVGVASSRNEKVNQTNSISGGKAYDNWDSDSSKIYAYTAMSASAAKTDVLAYAGRMKNQDYNNGTIGKPEPIIIPDLNGTLIKSLKRLDEANFANWSIQNNLKVGDKIFGDRENTFTSLPSALLGSEWIRTACDSKSLQSNVADFIAGKGITVYIALDSRVVERDLPSWINGWTKTFDILETSNGLTGIIYMKDFSEGDKITLGTNGSPDGVVMYSVFAVQKDGAVTTTPPETTTTPPETEPPLKTLDGTLVKGLNRLDTKYGEFWSVQSNMQVGDIIHGDRENTFIELPKMIVGAEWIRTASDSKNTNTTLAQFTAGDDLTALAAFDSRMEKLPDWMSGFTETGETITASNGVIYNLYAGDFAKDSQITLGTNGQVASVLNYFMIVIPKNATNYILGDTDGNGIINAIDLNIMKRELLNPSGINYEDTAFDMDKDKALSIADFVALRNFLHGRN